MKMPELEEIFTTVAIVCHRYERLAVLQNVFAITCFEQVKALNYFSEELSSSKIKKKRRSREDWFVTWKMPKLA